MIAPQPVQAPIPPLVLLELSVGGTYVAALAIDDNGFECIVIGAGAGGKLRTDAVPGALA